MHTNDSSSRSSLKLCTCSYLFTCFAAFPTPRRLALSNIKDPGLVNTSLDLFGTPVSYRASSHLLRSSMNNTSMVRSLPVHLKVYYFNASLNVFWLRCFPHLFSSVACRYLLTKTSVRLKKCTKSVSRKAPFSLMIAFLPNAWNTALRLERARLERCSPWSTMPIRLWLLKWAS